MANVRISDMKAQLKDLGFVKDTDGKYDYGVREYFFNHPAGEVALTVRFSRHIVELYTTPIAGFERDDDEYDYRAFERQQRSPLNLPGIRLDFNKNNIGRIIDVVKAYKELFVTSV